MSLTWPSRVTSQLHGRLAIPEGLERSLQRGRACRTCDHAEFIEECVDARVVEASR